MTSPSPIYFVLRFINCRAQFGIGMELPFRMSGTARHKTTFQVHEHLNTWEKKTIFVLPFSFWDGRFSECRDGPDIRPHFKFIYLWTCWKRRRPISFFLSLLFWDGRFFRMSSWTRQRTTFEFQVCEEWKTNRANFVLCFFFSNMVGCVGLSPNYT